MTMAPPMPIRPPQRVSLPFPPQGTTLNTRMQMAAEAEAAVLGACLIRPDAIHEAAEHVSPEHFSLEKNTRLFAAIQNLAEEGVPSWDPVTIRSELVRLKQADEWSQAELSRLFDATPEAANVPYYAKIVRASHYHRELCRLYRRCAGDMEAGSDFNAAMELASKSALEAQHLVEQSANVEVHEAESLVREAVESLGRIHRIATPLPMFDADECSPVIGRYNVLAARTSHGKTALALNLALHLLQRGQRVIYYSMETGRETLTLRMAAILCGLSLKQIKKDPGGAAFQTAVEQLRHMPLIVLDRKRPIGQILAIVRAKHRQIPVVLLVVDYLQRYGQRDEIDPVVDALVEFAKAERVCVVACSQITKQHTNKGAIDTGRPLLYSLKESATISEAANVAWILWRPERDGYKYLPDNKSVSSSGMAELIVAKNSDGPLMCKWLEFGVASFRFRESIYANAEGNQDVRSHDD